MAQMNQSTEKKQAHGHREQTCGLPKGGEGEEVGWTRSLGLERQTIAFGVDKQ